MNFSAGEDAGRVLFDAKLHSAAFPFEHCVQNPRSLPMKYWLVGRRFYGGSLEKLDILNILGNPGTDRQPAEV